MRALPPSKLVRLGRCAALCLPACLPPAQAEPSVDPSPSVTAEPSEVVDSATVVAPDDPGGSGPTAALGSLTAPARALSRDDIREVIRAHISDVRDCYNAGLTTDPALQGRVEIKFVINAGGTVSSAVVAEDTLANPAVGLCMAKAVLTWVFPAPKGGGNVNVTYPFNLVPG
jgi:outer membrane biosynthesis protein TonB